MAAGLVSFSLEPCPANSTRPSTTLSWSQHDGLLSTSLLPLVWWLLVVGTVTAIDEVAPGKGGDVILTNDERIHYDVLALATGSTWSGPLNFPQSDAEVIASINDWRNKIANAKHVVVVGGGAVGIGGSSL